MKTLGMFFNRKTGRLLTDVFNDSGCLNHDVGKLIYRHFREFPAESDIVALFYAERMVLGCKGCRYTISEVFEECRNGDMR